MRLYCKLVLLTLVTCLAQTAISTGVAGETYFAVRCLAATAAGNQTLQAALVDECEKHFIAERRLARTAIALNAGSGGK